MVTISEARLNDIVYMTLKKIFFEPCMNTNPRECDIRICMDMSVQSRITSLTQAILSPNEVAGKSHTTMYEVDTDKIFEECITYLEDYWLKATLDEACGTDGARQSAKQFYDEMLPTLLALPEAECGG